MTRGGSGLTDRRRKWIDVYLQTRNATEASRVVGYKYPRQAGHNLLQNPVVKEEIKRRMAATEMEVGEILYRFAEQARANIADFIAPDPAGGIKLNWEEIKRRGYLIKSIKHTRSGPILELHDSQKALELIGKHLGMFVEKVSMESNQTGEITVRFVSGHPDQLVSPAPASGVIESGGVDGTANGRDQPGAPDS